MQRPSVSVTEGKACCISDGCESVDSPMAGRTRTDKVSPERHNEVTGATCPMCPDCQPQPHVAVLGNSVEITVALSPEEGGNGALEAPSGFLHAAPDD